jgi:glycosyltransferase involved in cell wall biosynthesis
MSIGGSEVQVNLLARELSLCSGLSVDVLVADFGQEPERVVDSVRLIRSIKYGTRPISMMLALFQAMKYSSADIYLQRALSPVSALTCFFAYVLHKKFVYMVAHDGETSVSGWVVRGRLSGWVNSLAFRFADLVIAQNDFQKISLARKYPKVKVAVLKKGLKLPAMDQERESERNVDAVWIGRCTEFKNPEAFIALAKSLPSRSFLMVAPPALNEQDYFEKIKRSATHLENLTFIDKLSNKDVYRTLNTCKIFCFTSYEEGDWPMTVLEAVSCGLPVLSLFLNYDALIDDYNAGIFCSGDSSALTLRLNELLADPARLNEMKQQTLKFSNDKLNIKQAATTLLGYLKEL